LQHNDPFSALLYLAARFVDVSRLTTGRATPDATTTPNDAKTMPAPRQEQEQEQHNFAKLRFIKTAHRF
jgi:hypothetical protein